MTKQSSGKTADKKHLTKTKLAKTDYDFGFLIIVALLLAVGLLMVFSSSYPSAHYNYNDGLYFIKRQLIWAVAGVIAMIFTANFDYRKYKKMAFPLLIATFLCLLAVLVVGKKINGARRWLGFGPLTFQPSEMAKLTLIIYFATGLSVVKNKIKEFKYLMRYLIITGVCMGLMLLQPHFSVCIIIGLTAVVVLLAAGARLTHFALLAAPVAVAGVALVISSPYRLARLTTFLDPFADAQNAGWQIIQSLYAIGSGGFFGVGFGNSRQKFLYVSEPQNDFIFSILCEELGLLGALTVLALFGVLLWRGMKIAISAPDTFGSLLVTGIIASVGVQVVLNIAVVTSSIPTTGIPLPFFSYGGSSLLLLMASMGIVLNVSKYQKQTLSEPHI